MRLVVIVSLVLLLFTSCNKDKSPINYGSDQCSHCQMMIMDQRFGAEIVTDKGKVFKFDAIECLINFKNENEGIEEVVFSEWTNTVDSNGELIPVEEVNFVRSVNLPSPMGMYISAFKELDKANTYVKDNTGTVYNWKDLKENFPHFRDLSEISGITP